MRTKLCPKIVGIEGRRFEAVIRNADKSMLRITECPDNLKFINSVDENRNKILYFEGLHQGRGFVSIEINEKLFKVPYVIFKEKEFFLSMVITSNYHIGYDPENLIRGCEDERLANVTGHGFNKTCRCLEPIYHNHGMPITWLIDPVVAKEGKEKLEGFHYKYADDYGILPSSYFHHNSRNYNFNNTVDETADFLEKMIFDIEEQFDYYTELVGIDQWIGGVGSNFVKASEKLGMKGIWGIGFDHPTCDTSMFHRGCPWDMYKPDKDNVKMPCKYPSDLWAFQWTTRDIINTVHTPTGASGAVMFSTDPDDIRAVKIMQNQKDYYTRMLSEYRKNMKYNDFFVFLLHQEDHESHIEEDNLYLDNFLQEVKSDVTPATLQEVLSWLNLKYGKEEHPTQKLCLEDPLTCQNELVWRRGNVQKPEDWGMYDGKYPIHGAFYSKDYQIIIQKPERKPYRVFNYKKGHEISESEVYPEETYNNVTITSESIKKLEDGWIYQVKFISDQVYIDYPYVVWEVPKGFDLLDIDKDTVITEEYIIFFANLKTGENEFRFKINFKYTEKLS